MAEANLDGNGYWYPLKSHDDENDPLVPSTPNQSPHNSFKFKTPRGPGDPVDQGTLHGLFYCPNSFFSSNIWRLAFTLNLQFANDITNEREPGIEIIERTPKSITSLIVQ